MIYIETGSTDVYYNFGLENYFAVEKRLPDTVFLFWRTTPTLMVGKYQNILEEINKPYADAHGIRLVRRMSGGGTIYTDLGGWQFTFIQHADAQEIEFHQYIAPVISALRELGVNAAFNGRNDLTIDGKNSPATHSTALATASFTTARCCLILTSSRWSPPRLWTATRSSPRASNPSATASRTSWSICPSPWTRRLSSSRSCAIS